MSEYPKVIDEVATVQALLMGNSIARYGDGELKLMDGKGYFREPGSPSLTAELLGIFQSPHPQCCVGVPTMSPRGPKYENWMRHAARFAKMMRSEVQYYSAFITRPDSAPWINTVKFAGKIERLWRRKKTVVMSEPGNKILTAARLSASSLIHIPCPSREAYAQIDRLEGDIIAARPDIALLSCGPTATCLAHRLCRSGIHAVDIGSAGGFLVKLLLQRSEFAHGA